MTTRLSVKLADRGILTIPGVLRKKYGLNRGDVMALLDLNGVFVLTPKASKADLLADEIREELASCGESLERMLRQLRRSRAGSGRND